MTEVVVRRNGSAVKIPVVATGATIGEVLISSGLHDGDEVLLSPTP